MEKKLENVMVDIETLGNKPGSVITSIGAVRFDPETGAEGETFYRTVRIQSCLDVGLKVDGSTLEWWLRQESRTRAAMLAEPVDLQWVLLELESYLHPDPILWAFGASFDISILEAAYAACGRSVPPWSFRRVRCSRTLLALIHAPAPEPVEPPHHALSDAIYQARHVVSAFRHGQLPVLNDEKDRQRAQDVLFGLRYHGCMTGDCPHMNEHDCLTALTQAIRETDQE